MLAVRSIIFEKTNLLNASAVSSINSVSILFFVSCVIHLPLVCPTDVVHGRKIAITANTSKKQNSRLKNQKITRQNTRQSGVNCVNDWSLPRSIPYTLQCTAACAAGVVTRTTDRDSSRYHYSGIRRVRQLALGRESN